MLRDQFNDALKQAMRDKDVLAGSTVRLILARLKERDIEVRPKGNLDGIADPEIQSMMQGMIKQRRESIELYRGATGPSSPRKSAGRSRSSSASCRRRCRTTMPRRRSRA